MSYMRYMLLRRLYRQSRRCAKVRSPNHRAPQLRTVVGCMFFFHLCFHPAVLSPAGSSDICPVLAPHAAQVEESVERGLRYLIGQQQQDGSFPGRHGDTAGMVSLAGLSFLAAGHTPGRDAYGEMINRCLDYVMAQQNSNGYINGSTWRDGSMYSHHIATLFLAEVSGMVDPQREERVREALAGAVKVILASQQAAKSHPRYEGGWQYSPRASRSDLSVSGWAVMALRSARLNGARVPDENMQQAIDFVLRMQHESGGFGYMNPEQHRPTLTALAILCLALTGYHDSEEVELGRRYLMAHYRRMPDQPHALYGVYYGVQAAFQLGGENWEEIGSWFFDTYLLKQQDDGSWSPGAGGRVDVEQGSPAYRTALLVLALTVPYRQLPIYQRDETVD